MDYCLSYKQDRFVLDTFHEPAIQDPASFIFNELKSNLLHVTMPHDDDERGSTMNKQEEVEVTRKNKSGKANCLTVRLMLCLVKM